MSSSGTGRHVMRGHLETFIRYRVVEVLLAAVSGALLVGLMQYSAQAATHLAQRVEIEQRLARAHARVIQLASDQPLKEEWRTAAQVWQGLLRDDRFWQAPSLPETEVLSVSTVPLSDNTPRAHTSLRLQGPFHALMAWLTQISTDQGLRRMTSFHLEQCTSCLEPRFWQVEVGLMHGLDKKEAGA